MDNISTNNIIKDIADKIFNIFATNMNSDEIAGNKANTWTNNISNNIPYNLANNLADNSNNDSTINI